MEALSQLDIPEVQDMYAQQTLARAMAPKGTPEDVDGDGKPDGIRLPDGTLRLDPRTAAQEDAAKLNYYRQTTGADAAASRQNAMRLAQMGGGAAGGKAPSGYEWAKSASGALELAPIKGGPADPAKLQPGELSKIRNSNKQIDELEKSLDSYVSNLNKTSGFGRLVDRGAEVSRVETGHTDLLMQMKNLYELGVLNGPDYMLMTKIVEDPTGLMQVWRGNEGLTAQTDTVKSIINRARNLNNDRLQQAGVDAYRNTKAEPQGDGGTSGTPKVTTKAQYDALKPGQEYIAPDGTQRVKQ
jgi:hypothetical protein